MINALLDRILIRYWNPVFTHDLRRLRGGLDALRSYAFGWLVVAPIVVGLLWLLVLATSTDQVLYQSRAAELVIFVVFLINLALLLVSNVVYAFLTVNSLSEQIIGGQWDILRLTDLGIVKIIDAKFAVAQLRAWRVMIIDMALRIVLVELVLLGALRLLWPMLLSGMRGYYGFDFYDFWLAICLGAFALVYIYEPVWRMRAIIALGIANSARVHNLAFALIRIFLLIVAMHMVQAAVFGVSTWLLTSAWLLTVWNVSMSALRCTFLWAFPLYLASLSAFTRWMYATIQRRALQHASNTPFGAY